jgi:hypothetical protein
LPFRFDTTAGLIAGLAALPDVDGTGIPVPNRIWWERGVFFGGPAGTVICLNSDIRGGMAAFGNTRNQQIVSAPSTAVVFDSPKRVEDVEISATAISFGGLITNGASREIYYENVTVTAPLNAVAGPSPITHPFGGDAVFNRCRFDDPGIAPSPGGFGEIFTLLDDNVFTAGSIDDAGGAPFVFLAIKGTGNFISPSAPDPAVTLDVDIGGQALSVSGLPFSGAESMTFGCGPFTLPPLAAPDGAMMYPGGGNTGDAAPVLLTAGTLSPGIAAKKAAVMRGIYLIAEAPFGGAFVDIDVYQAGILVMTEAGVFLSPFGTYVQSVFAFITGPAFPAAAPGDISVVIRDPLGSPGTGWTSLNVTLLLK